MHIQFNNVSWVDFSSSNQEIRCIWTGAYLRRDRLKTWIGNNWEFALSKLSIWAPSHLVSFFPPPFLSPCFMFFFLLSLSLPALPLSLFLSSPDCLCCLSLVDWPMNLLSVQCFCFPITLAVEGRSLSSFHPGEMALSVFSVLEIF